MTRVLAILGCAVLLVPAAARAQEEEGTYSTYSSAEALGGYPALSTEIEQAPPPGVDERPTREYTHQEMFEGFWSNLSPYGTWTEDRRLGWIWFPEADAAFQPYTDGRWVYTTDGWTFLSDAPYSWATYHYGRWAFLDSRWAWVPGYEWAPAWVSFRNDDQYIGWAPLGPWGPYDYWVTGSYGHRYSPWIYVGFDRFSSNHCRTWAVRSSAAFTVHNDSRPVGSVTRDGPPRWALPRVHASEPVKMTDARNPFGSSSASGFNGGPVSLYRIGRGEPLFSRSAKAPSRRFGDIDFGSEHGSAATGPQGQGRPVAGGPGFVQQPGDTTGSHWTEIPVPAPQAQPSTDTWGRPHTAQHGFGPPVASPPEQSGAGFARPETHQGAAPSFSRPESHSRGEPGFSSGAHGSGGAGGGGGFVNSGTHGAAIPSSGSKRSTSGAAPSWVQGNRR